MKVYIGIDNGVSGSIGIIRDRGEAGSIATFIKTPVKKELSYTKAKQYVTRIDSPKLIEILKPFIEEADSVMALIERPMVNPTRWKASVSGIRALEATLVIIETLCIPYAYIDSKEWQKALLPKGLKGEELKQASLDIGKRFFPSVNIKHPDYDGLLIAEYCKRKHK